MINFEKYSFIIFDCDGVILDSNKLKSEAFAEALINEPPDLVLELVEYHKKNGGISRYEKFRYYFEEIKKTIINQQDLKLVLNKFSLIVREGIIKCSYIPGVLEFINKAARKEVSMFVVSGSDETELNEELFRRGIIHLFKAVYGSPVNKINNTEKVIMKMGTKNKGIFFGDSKSDFFASKKFGLDFAFVKGVSEWKDGYLWNLRRGNLVIDNFVK